MPQPSRKKAGTKAAALAVASALPEAGRIAASPGISAICRRAAQNRSSTGMVFRPDGRLDVSAALQHSDGCSKFADRSGFGRRLIRFWRKFIRTGGCRIVDDASSQPVQPPDDPRISFAALQSRAGISGALNRALEMASGDYICVLDHDDFLSADALFRVVETLQQQRYEVLYSDEDYVDEKGLPVRPNLKPDWSPELLSNCMYMGHLVIASRSLMDKVGGFRSEFDGAQDYDLALRLTDQPAAVAHIPHISVSLAAARRVDRATSGCKAMGQRFGPEGRRRYDSPPRMGREGNGSGNPYPLSHRPKSGAPRTGQHRYSDRIGKISSNRTPAMRISRSYTMLPKPTGSYLVFLHDDVRPREPDWLANLLGGCTTARSRRGRSETGLSQRRDSAFGHRNRHARGAGYPGRGLFQSDYWRWLDYTRNVTAVSGACLVTRKQVFESLGGFDDAFRSDLADVDFCLRVRQAGLEVILEQRACLIHEERDRVRPSSKEQELFRKKWHRILAKPDPYYSRYLRLDREDTSLRMPTESASDGSSPGP